MSSVVDQDVRDVRSRAIGRPDPGRGGWLRFSGHYLEMVVAMLAGMVVFGALLGVVLGAVGLGYSHERHPTVASLEMAFTMSLGMVVWMRYRGHGWAGTLEMTAAMFAPLVVLYPLMWAGVITGMTVMMMLHVLMPVTMLAVMLRRRDEYRSAHHVRGERIVRIVTRGLAVVLAVGIIPAVVFITESRTQKESLSPSPQAAAATAGAVAAATPPVHDPAKPTVAVVIANEGANIADTLVTYEVLAATRSFNVYVVAPERRPVPLLGGLDLIPDLDFAQLDQRLRGASPDVTVVPAMPESETADHARVVARLKKSAGKGLVLSVCTGARVVAEAGLMDGRPATSHWYRLAGLEDDYPGVKWQRGVRYLDDGNLISTGGLLSGIDGALRVVERLRGPDAARAAAQAIGWTHYSPGRPATLPKQKLTVSDKLLYLLNRGFRWDAPTVGVVLTNGVGESELAAAFDPYAEHSMSVTTRSVGTPGVGVRSRHGLTFVPRIGLDEAADSVDRLVVPGTEAAARPDPTLAATAQRANRPVTYLNRQPGFAFTPALQDMATTLDVPSARWATKILEYPSGDIELIGPSWPWTLLLRPILLGLTGLALAYGALRLVRRN